MVERRTAYRCASRRSGFATRPVAMAPPGSRIVPVPAFRNSCAIVLLTASVQGGVGLQRPAADFQAERLRMVNEQLKGRDIRDPRVLDAILKVPRHLFVPESLRPQAYQDSPLPIGYDQTISQPYIVAF